MSTRQKSIFFMISATILAMVFVYCADAWADCGSDCAKKCAHHGSGKDYAACVQHCLKGCLDNDPPEVPPVPEPKPVPQSKPKSGNDTFDFYAKSQNQDSYMHHEEPSENTYVMPIILAQNQNYVPCYKDADEKPVLFRWCPTGKPWTPTNDQRNFCYSTSEDCAKAEMPRSWCIKCEN